MPPIVDRDWHPEYLPVPVVQGLFEHHGPPEHVVVGLLPPGHDVEVVAGGGGEAVAGETADVEDL